MVEIEKATRPKTIKVNFPNGDYHKGVSLEADGSRITLYVLESTVDGLRGSTPKGTIANFSLTGCTVEEID